MGQSAQKAALRKRMLAARAAHGALRAASQRVCARLLDLPELTVAHHILGYASMPSEVSVDAALQHWIDHGIAVYLPWVDGPDLEVSLVTDLVGGVAPGWRGVREPREPREPGEPNAPGRLDALIVPGLGFDLAGNRLGYGGGHFDRLLARVSPKAFIVGVALDEQVVDHLPTEAHDRGVDVIVTPSQTLRCRPSRL